MKKRKIEPKSKLWIEVDGLYLMGDGRAELLRCVDRLGSISGAARRLNMSYRHAWGHIRKIEERLGMQVVQTARGGARGGSARLTDGGKRLLNTFMQFRRSVDKAVEARFSRHFGKMEKRT